ncbi:MAG: beta-lactamase family protein [Chloracidobacterium sp.]|nr:beta-lactamase family protein [Chloracidobacterium sp.]
MKIRSAFALLVLLSLTSTAQVPNKNLVVTGAERAFEKASGAVKMPAPGCAVGVSLNGESVFEKAFGLAEMEHSVPNTPQTVFESGSVAKQFTASALVLLQQDGKLNIDDPVRKYIPELPDYGSPLTIRHMLNHTSGLRDWFSVRGLSGEGYGQHIVTQEMVLDTIVRQKALNYKPGFRIFLFEQRLSACRDHRRAGLEAEIFRFCDRKAAEACGNEEHFVAG